MCGEREGELEEGWERYHQLWGRHSFQHVLAENKAEVSGSRQQPAGQFVRVRPRGSLLKDHV